MAASSAVAPLLADGINGAPLLKISQKELLSCLGPNPRAVGGCIRMPAPLGNLR